MSWRARGRKDPADEGLRPAKIGDDEHELRPAGQLMRCVQYSRGAGTQTFDSGKTIGHRKRRTATPGGRQVEILPDRSIAADQAEAVTDPGRRGC